MVAMGDAIQRFVDWGNVMPGTRRDLEITRARLEARRVDVMGFGVWRHGRTLGQLFEAMRLLKAPPIGPCFIEPAPTAWEHLLADDPV